MGFSHWDRDNRLTDVLFHGFDPATQMFRVSEFKEILLALDRLPPDQTYVQILTNGLDSISHRHRGRPPVEAIARHLYEDVLLALVERLQEVGATALVYATADHGILWKPEPGAGKELIVVPDERANAHRYARGAFLVPHSRQFSCYGVNYTPTSVIRPSNPGGVAGEDTHFTSPLTVYAPSSPWGWLWATSLFAKGR